MGRLLGDRWDHWDHSDRTVSPGSAEGAGPGGRAAARARDTADRVRNGWPEPRDRAGRPDGRPPRDRAGGRAPGGTGLRASRDCLLGARRHTRHSLVPARRSAPTKLDPRPASVSTVTRTSYYLRRLLPNAPPVSRLRAPSTPAHAGFPPAGGACADRVAHPTPLPGPPDRPLRRAYSEPLSTRTVPAPAPRRESRSHERPLRTETLVRGPAVRGTRRARPAPDLPRRPHRRRHRRRRGRRRGPRPAPGGAGRRPRRAPAGGAAGLRQPRRGAGPRHRPGHPARRTAQRGRRPGRRPPGDRGVLAGGTGLAGGPGGLRRDAALLGLAGGGGGRGTPAQRRPGRQDGALPARRGGRRHRLVRPGPRGDRRRLRRHRPAARGTPVARPGHGGPRRDRPVRDFADRRRPARRRPAAPSTGGTR